MMSFVTDFETHVKLQGYVEDPAAKDFVVRKARTIALSEARGSCHKTRDNQPYSRVWKSLGDSLPKLYCVAWLGLDHAIKCQFKDFCEKERYDSCSVQRTFAPETFGKRRKRENSPVVRLLPGSSCFKKPTCSVWVRMYDILAWRANSTRNGTRNWIPVQPRKARRK
jgi:hypothetical protein